MSSNDVLVQHEPSLARSWIMREALAITACQRCVPRTTNGKIWERFGVFLIALCDFAQRGADFRHQNETRPLRQRRKFFGFDIEPFLRTRILLRHSPHCFVGLDICARCVHGLRRVGRAFLDLGDFKRSRYAAHRRLDIHEGTSC